MTSFDFRKVACYGATNLSAAISAHQEGFVRDRWVWDANYNKFSLPPCTTGLDNWTYGKYGHDRKRALNQFFSDNSGGCIVASPRYCSKCYKRLLVISAEGLAVVSVEGLSGGIDLRFPLVASILVVEREQFHRLVQDK